MTAGSALAGKAILVTGGASGIGAAVASALGSSGAKVLVGDIVTPADSSQDPASSAVHLDVRSATSVESVFARLEQHFGGVDALVHCAGIGVFKPLIELSDDEWDRVLCTNLTGAFLCTRAALRQMVRRGGGRIIHIGSISDHTPLPANGAYGVSKAGLRMLTQIINEEHKQDGVRATLISLGAVYTPVWRSRPEFDPADMLDVSDVARAVVNILAEPPHVRVDHVLLLPPKGVL